MIACLASKHCAHYFVRTENLFDGISDDMLHTVSKALTDVRRSLQFGRVYEQILEDDQAISKFSFLSYFFPIKE